MFSKKARLTGIICFTAFFLLVLRLCFIMTESGKTYKTMAINQQKRNVKVKDIRGEIKDRNGTRLTDTDSGCVYLLNNGRLSYLKKGSKYSFEFTKRAPHTAKHIIGYTNCDSEGVCGLEKEFNTVLKSGGSIYLEYMADATGAPVKSFEIKKEAESAASIDLTIDAEIQKIAEETLDKYIKKGAAVIIDVKTFDVLAMVSRPDFDTSQLENYATSTDGELLNRALMGYNAGSVFKIITASAALEKNSQYLQRYFDCQGKYVLNDGSTFGCHLSQGHGVLSFSNAFALSCNCCFYVTGLENGGLLTTATAKKFGLGTTLLNVNLEETKGNLPKNTEFTQAENMNLSIGQGEVLITPLQCAVMAATVANDGIRKDVNLVKGYHAPDGTYKDLTNTNSHRVIKQSTSLIISQMMRECVLFGTAKNAASSKANIAGKTGSAESGWAQNGQTMVHGWFCGFFPFDNPRYAMAVLCENGKSGADSCVAPFVEIAEKIAKIQ